MNVAPANSDEALTVPLPGSKEAQVVSLRGGRLEVVGERAKLQVGMDRLLVGRASACALVLDDPTISKAHLELQATPRGVRAVDLKSCNGTRVGGLAITEAYLTVPCEIQIGAKRLRFVPEAAREVVVPEPERFGGLVGTTPDMIELFAKLRRYAPTPMSIVIQGETGTGKERVAQAIHASSPRRDKRLVAVNCASVPEALMEAELFGHERGAFTGAVRANDGFFVEADGSTLLFDEVGEMSAAMQAKLLRVLETQEVRRVGSGRSRRVDVRVLFATHVDLHQAVKEGRFREDLYFRVAQLTVAIPPLRQRSTDLPVLVDDILASLGRTDVVVDDAAMSALLAHSWPGNVRQLRNVVQRALVECPGDRLLVERVLAPDSPEVERDSVTREYDPAREEFDRVYYTCLYERFGGNISKIARAAGKERRTVKLALRTLGLRD
jgi:DNA-binding NtrC family response regulator